jgi:hypothetical protein
MYLTQREHVFRPSGCCSIIEDGCSGKLTVGSEEQLKLQSCVTFSDKTPAGRDVGSVHAKVKATSTTGNLISSGSKRTRSAGACSISLYFIFVHAVNKDVGRFVLFQRHEHVLKRNLSRVLCEILAGQEEF